MVCHGVSLLIREQALSSSLLSREIRVHDLSLTLCASTKLCVVCSLSTG